MISYLHMQAIPAQDLTSNGTENKYNIIIVLLNWSGMEQLEFWLLIKPKSPIFSTGVLLQLMKEAWFFTSIPPDGNEHF